MRETAGESLGRVLDFMRLIWAISHGLQARSKHMEAAHGVTGPQRLVIRVLARMPDASAGRLAQILYLHPSTLTGVLKRLQDRGLVSRIQDPQDARRVRLRLTPRGRRMDALSNETVEAAVRGALCLVAPRKAKVAKEVLTALATALTGEPLSIVRKMPPSPGRRRRPRRTTAA